MSKLTAAQRRKMPQGEFAGPGHSFPINDAKHERLAISGATRAYNAGNISASQEASIKAKARKKLGGHQSEEDRKRQIIQDAIRGPRRA